MLILHLGPDSKKKRRELFELMVERPATVITTDQATLSFEQQLIGELSLPGLIDTQVTSFSHLLDTLSKDIFSPDKPLITPVGKKLLFRFIHEEKASSLEVFKSFDKDGFYEELESLISRLMADAVPPEALREAARQESGEALLRKKLSDLALLYETYLERKNDLFFDEEESLQLFEAEGHKFRLYEDRVFVMDYKHFGEREKRLLKCLGSHVSELHVALSYEAGQDDLYYVTERTLNTLKDLFSDVKIIEHQPEVGPSWAFRELSKKMVRLDETAFPLQAVSIYEAKDLYEEVEFIGLDILKHLREDETLRPEDIRLVTADLDVYGPIAESVFQGLGLSVFRDTRREILRTRILKSIFSLFSIYLESYKREDVISYLRSVTSRDDWDALDRFENYAIEQGIDRKKFFREWTIPDEEQGEGESLETIRKRFLDPVIKAQRFFEGKRTIGEFSDLTREALLTLKFVEQIEHERLELLEDGLTDEVEVLSQIWDVLVTTLLELKEVSNEETITLKKWRSILASSLKDVSVGVLPPSGGRISLATLHRSAHAPAKLLYLLGVNDGIIPREGGEGVLLRHEEKERLIDLGYDLSDAPYFNEKLDVMDLTTVFGLVSEELVLSYPVSDYSKDGLKPSAFITTVQRALEITPRKGLMDRYFEHQSIARRQAMLWLREGIDLDPDYFSPQEIRQLTELLSNDTATKNLQAKRLPPGKPTSISKLETFRNCAFRYFVHYDLKPKLRNNYEISIPDIGNFYHEIVEHVVKDYVQGQFTIEELDEYLKQEILRLLERPEYSVFTAFASSRYFVERARRIVREVLSDIFRHLQASDFLPSYFEEEFKIPLADAGGVVLQGKVDRIDVAEDEFLIVDYKSGSKEFDLNKVYQGLDLQLVTYAEAFSETHQSKVRGIFYQKVRDPITDDEGTEQTGEKVHDRLSGLIVQREDAKKAIDRRDVTYLPSLSLSKEQMDRLTQKVHQEIVSHIDRINQGDISILPDELTKPCDYCDYRAVCRFDRFSGRRRRTEHLDTTRLKAVLGGINEVE